MKFLFFILLLVSTLAQAAPFHVQSNLSVDEVVYRMEPLAKAQGFKWIRKVELREELGAHAPKGYAVYFCDVVYMATQKAANPLAGATGPCRSVVLETATGSELIMASAMDKRGLLGDTPDERAVLDARIRMLGLLAADSVTGTEQNVSGAASNWLYTQVSSNFYPETMAAAQNALAAAGFTLIRVQHMDKGLQSGGFQSNPYKILYVRPTVMASMAEDAVMALGLPLAILVMENDAGDGQISTMGTSYAASLTDDPDMLMYLADVDSKLSRVLASL